MEEDNQETKLCQNCQRNISAANFVMHEMHCRRHITLCEHCKEPVPKSELEQHFEENHAKIACQKCGVHIEKNLLEKHEEESCSKRPIKCHYCEMDVAQNEFEAHSEYCGTRTEPCVKCGQYIMIKDQIKHEDSNCTYPTPKPTNENASIRNTANGVTSNINTGASGNRDDEDFLFGSGDIKMDPFVFDEMQRILNGSDISGAAAGNRNIGRPEMQRNLNPKVTNKNAPANKNVPGNKNVPVNSRKIEKNLSPKNKSNKKSDLNRQREISVSHGNSLSNEEHDRLLAMHLAQDLNQEDDMDKLMESYNTESVAIPTYTNTSYLDVETNFADSIAHQNDTDGMSLSMLPCEFCGEAMPSDCLVEHQSSCTLDPFSSLMPQNAASSNDGINANIQQTDNRYSRLGQETRPNPPFIDNLSEEIEWHEMHPEYDATSSEDFMLPCEFCDELFPVDCLVQHQAMCDTNGTVTPRFASPPLTRSSQRQPEQPDSSRSKRRQQEPDLSAILKKTSDRRTPSSGAAWSTRGDVTPQQEIHSTMHKYGVSPGESVIPRHSRNAILEHLAREKENKTLKSSRGTSHPTSSKRIDSATRTRNTLENLLHEDIGISPPHHDLHRHVNVTVNAAKKYNKDNFNTKQKKLPVNYSTSSTTTVSRPVPTSTAAAGTTRSSRTTGVSSREVHRQLEELNMSESVNPSQKTTKSTRSSRNLADRPPPSSSSTSNGASRQRTRNNIFDSGNRNTRSTRRSSDDYQ